jgi:hypothetical protein
MSPLCRISLLAVVANICRARLAAEQQRAGRHLRTGAPPSNENLREEVRHALSSALGDGHGVEQSHLDTVRNKLSHTWASLPKNALGLVTRRSMRYVVHRYFLQTYHISIIGLEAANEGSSTTEAALLTNFVPSYVRNVLEGKEATSGFSLADAVALIAVLDQLILDSAASLLSALYKGFNYNERIVLPLDKVFEIVSEYVMYWTTGNSEDLVLKDFQNNRMNTDAWRRGVFWTRITTLAQGAVQGFMFGRDREPRHYLRERASGGTWHPLSPEFSFTDVQTVVLGIIHSFGNYWAPECDDLKHALVDVDRSQTGRVHLSDFHTTATSDQWDLSESADFLQHVGALDNSSSWLGARVIITNYIQATSNCVILAPHYRVCCANECEEHMDELEMIVGAPDAAPELLLSAVENISAAWYGDEDFVDEDYYEDTMREPSLGNRKPQLPSSLRQQLHDIALVQGGKVPLHGRLFAQWLHYAFPHECPYPHKSGTVRPMTPEAYEADGKSFKASNEEVLMHLQKAEELYDLSNGDPIEDDSEFMSQWDHEEELLANHVGLKAPWEKSRPTMWFVLAFPGVLLVRILFTGVSTPTQKRDLSLYC